MANPDPNKLKVKRDFSRPGVLFSVARMPQSTQLFLGSSDGNVYDLDIEAEKLELGEFKGHRGYVMEVVLAGNYVVSGAYDGQLIWWGAQSREQVRSIKAHKKWVRAMDVSPDGKIVASVSDDMVCRLWDGESGKPIRELRGHQEKTPHHFPSMLFCCRFSSDGKYLATGDKVGHVVVWETATGKQMTAIETPTMYTWDPKQRIHSIGGVRSLAFSPDSRLLAIGGMGQVGNIDHLGAMARWEIFDWRNGEQTHKYDGDTHKGLVEQMQFGPDGKWLLAAGGDHGGFIKFYELDTSKIIKQDKAPMHVHDFTMNEDQDTIYAAGHGKIVVWQLT